MSSLVAQEESGDVKTPETLSGKPADFLNRATLPYQQLIKIAQSDASSKPDAESYKLKIRSKNLLVKASDIELYLDREDGPLYLVVDNDNFVEVPHTKELIEENPDLVSNQPKRTLDIFVDLAVPQVDPPKLVDGKVRYQELFRPLLDIQTEMRKVDPTFGLEDQQLVLEIESGEESVKITRELGSRSFDPDEDGKIYMILESYLYEENPMVEMPQEASMQVIPRSSEEVEKLRSR